MTKNNNYVQLLEDENKKLLAGNQETPLVVSSDGASGSTIQPENAQSGGYVSPYAQQIEQAMGQVQNSTFQYNQAEDPNWQAMRKQYLLDAERSMKDVLGQASAATGGRASTAAINAASQAADYYKSQLNTQQQTLYQAAYERYYNQFTQDLNKLSALQAQDAEAYQRYLDERNAAIAEQERANEAQSTAYERLVTLIASTGYSPSAEELAASGMSASEAKSWAKYYADQKALASNSGGGGGGYSYSSGGSSGGSGNKESVVASGGSLIDRIDDAYDSGGYSAALKVVDDAYKSGEIVGVGGLDMQTGSAGKSAFNSYVNMLETGVDTSGWRDFVRNTYNNMVRARKNGDSDVQILNYLKKQIQAGNITSNECKQITGALGIGG